MEQVTFYNDTRGTVLVLRAFKSRHLGHHLLGLLPRSGLGPEEGLWLRPCRAIHTFGMRFSIDAIFLDRGLTVVGLMRNVRPFRLGKLFSSTHSVLEVSAGVVASSGTEVGDRLKVEAVRSALS
jgi:uncharacterized membrane protein (UPF0127 family)